MSSSPLSHSRLGLFTHTQMEKHIHAQVMTPQKAKILYFSFFIRRISIKKKLVDLRNP